MKPRHAIMLAMAILGLGSPQGAQEQEPIKEIVAVVNVEVPVRVFADGQSVTGLSRDDFEISEDGKRQSINGFTYFHKKISGAAEPGAPPAAPPPGRYFVLVFSAYELNDELEKGVRYLFERVLRPQDQVLALINTRVLAFDDLGSEPDAQSRILELLRSECLAARNVMLGNLASIEQSLNITQFRIKMKLSSGSGAVGGDELTPDYLKGFLQSYLDIWRQYKARYLSLDLDKFYYFAKHLEGVRREKWVLNFYQLAQFPQIAFGSEIERLLRDYIDMLTTSDNPTLKVMGRLIEKLVQEIHMEMKVRKDFPADEASKLFYKVNATFHSFFIRSFHDTGNPQLEFRSVVTDIENSLRELTEATGGVLSVSNKVQDALADVVERADDYYVLTYEPANAKKVGKIKVKVRGGKYKVLYDNNIRADYIRAYLEKKEAGNRNVRISDLSFKDKVFAFVIRDFSRPKPGGDSRLAVRIRVRDEDDESLFDQGKNLTTDQDTLSLSLSLAFLRPGRYDIIVDVLDQVSGRTATEILQPLVR